MHIKRRHNIEREKYEHELMQMLEDTEMNVDPEETNQVLKSGLTSII